MIRNLYFLFINLDIFLHISRFMCTFVPQKETNNLTLRIMSTYKITYFEENLEIASVTTFHNISSQHDLLVLVSSFIYSLDLLPMVRCMRGEEDLTVETNKLLKGYIRDLKKTDISKLKRTYRPTYKPFHLHQ